MAGDRLWQHRVKKFGEILCETASHLLGDNQLASRFTRSQNANFDNTLRIQISNHSHILRMLISGARSGDKSWKLTTVWAYFEATSASVTASLRPVNYARFPCKQCMATQEKRTYKVAEHLSLKHTHRAPLPTLNIYKSSSYLLHQLHQAQCTKNQYGRTRRSAITWIEAVLWLAD